MECGILSFTALSLCIFVGLGVTLADDPRIFEKLIDKILNKIFK